jgi:WD40 repeat protein
MSSKRTRIATHTKSSVIKLKTAYEIVFSPDEDCAAFLGARNVSVLHLATTKPLFSVRPIDHLCHIDFSPDGRRLVVKSTSGRTITLDAQTGQTLQDFRNQKEGEGPGALFSNCGRYVVSVLERIAERTGQRDLRACFLACLWKSHVV